MVLASCSKDEAADGVVYAKPHMEVAIAAKQAESQPEDKTADTVSSSTPPIAAKLRGTILTEDAGKSFAIIEVDGTQGMYKIGDVVEGGAILKSVDKASVQLEREGSMISLAVDAAESFSSQKANVKPVDYSRMAWKKRTLEERKNMMTERKTRVGKLKSKNAEERQRARTERLQKRFVNVEQRYASGKITQEEYVKRLARIEKVKSRPAKRSKNAIEQPQKQ